MPVPIIKILINERNLVGNPIPVSLWTFADKMAIYVVYSASDLVNPIYKGEVHSVSGWARIDNLNSIFKDLHPGAGVGTYFISLIDPETLLEFSGRQFKVYGGGISKLLLRELDRTSNAGSIFDWKLKNSTTNFFLTTRTNDYVIHIPEDELLPLPYYAQGMKFDIKNGDDIIEIIDNSADTEESLQTIDFQALRLTAIIDFNRWCSEFRIVTDSGWSCTVIITESLNVSNYAIKFKNSFGIFEKISVVESLDYTPEFEEGEKFAQFDSIVHDFVSKNSRKNITNKYTAQYSYRSAADRLFLIDALQSDEVYFIANGREYACELKASSQLLVSQNGNPVAVTIDIQLIDTDTFFSPLLEDSSIGLTADYEDVTADGADILV